MAKKNSEYLASLERRTTLENAKRDARFVRVTGYHTGDFVGLVLALEMRSVRMQVERSSSGEIATGSVIEVPFNRAVHFTSL